MFLKNYHPSMITDLSAATHTLTYCQGNNENAICGGDAVGLFKFPGSSALFSSNTGTSRRGRRQTSDSGKNTRFANSFRRQIE
jgi:hypothetical protein